MKIDEYMDATANEQEHPVPPAPPQTYRANRRQRSGRDITIASGCETMAEAAEVALRLERLQERELGGEDEFYAEPE